MNVSKAITAFAVTLTAASAHAADPDFGPSDVKTVFFFAKSDDKNRVDYGLRLDDKCQTVGDEPLFPYWHEFEGDPTGAKTHSLKFYEYAGYGVSEQKIKKVAGTTELTAKLKAFPRDIVITVEKGSDGKCVVTPRAVIGAKPNVELVSAYIKLKRFASVEYVEVKGRDKGGAELVEKLLP